MPALFLDESDVDELLTMDDAIDAVRSAFRKQAQTEVANIPRGRARTDHGMIHLMGATVKTMDVMGCKVYTTTKLGARFLVLLYHGATGDLLAVIQANRLGAMRTGAATGVATSCMARDDADTVGIFGSGFQARTQLEAVCKVRDIVEAYVYSPTPEHREAFANEMTTHLGITVVAVTKPELAAEDKDIVITATKSSNPVLSADWINEGCHINAIGSNFIAKTEVDVEVVRKCDPIVIDDKEQGRLEAGELVQAVEEGVIRWSDVTELGNVVVEREPGRHGPSDISMFKSVGVAFEDVAVAKVVYDRAVAAGVGKPLPF